MLCIEFQPYNSGAKDAAPMRIEWHTGEPLPVELGRARVVKFQADGDELDLILRTLKGHYCKGCGATKNVFEMPLTRSLSVSECRLLQSTRELISDQEREGFWPQCLHHIPPTAFTGITIVRCTT